MAAIDAIVVDEISENPNFLKLADDNTSEEEFASLLQEHVCGYSQKKRCADGLKDFAKKVEDAENRLIVARNVGKFKEPDADDKKMTTNYSSFELKQKVTLINAQVQSMIDEGQITRFEKPQVLENLRSRLAKAKEAGKEKAIEKLDRMLGIAAKADGFVLPVANITQFYSLDKEIQAIEKLERLSSKSLTFAIRERIESKESIQAEYDALVETSHFWFETVNEFKPRLHEAVSNYERQEEERKKREEEEAFAKKCREEDEALERKREEAERKEMARVKALEEKLKEKREEAAAKPVKEVPKKQPKEKKAISKVDLQQMFHEEPDYEDVDAAQLQAEFEAEQKRQEWAKAYAELAKAKQEMEEAKRQEKKEQTVQKREMAEKMKELEAARKAVAKAASATKSAAKGKEPLKVEPAKPKKSEEEKQQEEEAKFKAIEERLAAKRAEAESKPQKEKAEPKKKEKKVASKMSLLDFYGDDHLDKLAAQGKEEKAAAAAAAKEAEKAAARLAAEEEAEWAAEEAAWVAEQARIDAERLAALVRSAGTSTKEAPAAAAAAPTAAPAVESVAKLAPKPKRKAPVERQSMWGAPSPASATLDLNASDDLLERLAAQEAGEKAQRAAREAAEKREAEIAAAEEGGGQIGLANAKEAPWANAHTRAPEAEEDDEASDAADEDVEPEGEAKGSGDDEEEDDENEVEPDAKPAPKPKREPVEIESRWGATSAPPVEEQEVCQDFVDMVNSGPSLADSMKMPVKKMPPPAPKKKEKKKWGKVDANLMGFDY